MTQRKGNNPWVTNAMSSAARAAYGEAGRYFLEDENADLAGAIKCPNGHNAYVKSSVGAYICPTCGLMRCPVGYKGEVTWI